MISRLCVGLLLVGMIAPVALSDTEACIPDRDVLMALSPYEFDQSASNGWRSVSDVPGCEIAAADLIRDYHGVLRTAGEPVYFEDELGGRFEVSSDGAVRLMYWHEGQLRAVAGQTEAAAELFHLSLSPPENDFGGWNAYVRASIAFLENDREELLSQREEVARQDFMGRNLRVVDFLVACFGSPYRKAYVGTCAP